MTPTPLTDADLAELERLVEAATPGPWERGEGYGASVIFPPSESEDNPDEPLAIDLRCDDADFIVAACNLAPALAAEVRRLRERLASCTCGCGEEGCGGH